MAERPPFDEEDARKAAAYLVRTNRTAYDPFAPEHASSEQILPLSLADTQRMMAEAFVNRNAAGQAFRVFPLFVAHPSPGAFAVVQDGLHICGLNTGLVTGLFELAMFVFSQSGQFQDVGFAAGERSPVLPPDAALGYWISDRLLTGEARESRTVGAELIPKDQQRQRAALMLTLLMLRFVWLHELDASIYPY